MAADREQTRRDAERYAQRFHEAYERLAPSFGYETREASAVPWESVPLMNKRLMIAVVGEVLDALLAELEQAERQLSETQELLRLLIDILRSDRHLQLEAVQQMRGILADLGAKPRPA